MVWVVTNLFSGSFGVNAYNIFGAGGSHERSASWIFRNHFVNFVLQTGRRNAYPLRIGSGDNISIGDGNLFLEIRQIRVRIIPILDIPSVRLQNHFDQKHIGNGIANRFVDNVDGEQEPFCCRNLLLIQTETMIFMIDLILNEIFRRFNAYSGFLETA